MVATAVVAMAGLGDPADAGYPSATRPVTVFSGERRSGRKAAGASASGRTAPTIDLSRPSLSR
jgi:hypothetical protein